MLEITLRALMLFWWSMPATSLEDRLMPPCWYSQVLYSNLLATSIIIIEIPAFYFNDTQIFPSLAFLNLNTSLAAPHYFNVIGWTLWCNYLTLFFTNLQRHPWMSVPLLSAEVCYSGFPVTKLRDNWKLSKINVNI